MAYAPDNVIEFSAYRKPLPSQLSAAEHVAAAALIIAKHSWSTESAGTDIKKH